VPRVPGLGLPTPSFGLIPGRLSLARRSADDAPRCGPPSFHRATGLDIHAALGGVVLEVAGIHRGGAPVDLDDRVRHAADQVTVVRDEHDRSAEGVQRILEHVARLDVEVVRRLIEAQEVGGIGQQLREREPRLLAAGEDPHLLLHRRA
jgi:hypothetical protein